MEVVFEFEKLAALLGGVEVFVPDVVDEELLAGFYVARNEDTCDGSL